MIIFARDSYLDVEVVLNMSATPALESHKIAVGRAVLKFWCTYSVPNSRKMPYFALPNVDLSVVPASSLPRLAAKMLRICTEGDSNDLIFHCSKCAMVKEDHRLWNYWQNSVVSNTFINNRQRFALKKGLRPVGADWLSLTSVEIAQERKSEQWNL